MHPVSNSAISILTDESRGIRIFDSQTAAPFFPAFSRKIFMGLIQTTTETNKFEQKDVNLD